MRQKINKELIQGFFRIYCKKCRHVYINEYGNMTEWALATSKQSKTCLSCGSEVILEANPKVTPNKYNAVIPIRTPYICKA